MIYLDLGGQGPGLTDSPAHLSALDRSFLYGDGLFETVLVHNRRMPLWPLHLERLTASADALAIPLPDGLADAAAAVAKQAGPGDHALRLTLSRGPAPGRGYEPPAHARPTVLIASTAYTRPGGPFSGVIASSRLWPESPTVRHKSTSALEWVVGRQEARAKGAQEAIYLNVWGRVAQGAATNIFVVSGGQWKTPPLSQGALPGIMRRRVIDVMGAMESPLTLDDIHQADSVVLTNALMGCIHLSSLDDQSLPTDVALPDLDALLR